MFDLLTPNAIAKAVEDGDFDYQKVVELINKYGEETKGETK